MKQGIKPRILFTNEASFLNTGFSIYGKNIISRLYATGKYDILEMGTYCKQSDPRVKNIPWKFVANCPEDNDQEGQRAYGAPGSQEYHLNQFGLWKFNDILLNFRPHVCVDVRDNWMWSWQLKNPLIKNCTLITLPCVDSHPQQKQWIEDYKKVDYVLGYSNYALDVLRRESGGKINIAGLANPGADIKTYKPIWGDNLNPSEEEIEKNRIDALAKFGVSPHAKFIGMVARNQKRKRFDVFIETASKLKRDNPEWFRKNHVYFHCHTSFPDVGTDLPEVINRERRNGLTWHDITFSYVCHKCGAAFFSYYLGDIKGRCQVCGDPQSAMMPNTQKGFTFEQMAQMYRAMYATVNLSIAGAFELPIAESKSCGVPVLAIDYAAMAEQGRKIYPGTFHLGGMSIKRGYLATEIGETGQWRCLPDRDDTAKQIKWIIDHPKERNQLAREARQCALDNFDYDKIAKKWEEVIDNAEVYPEIYTWNKPIEIKSLPQENPASDLSDEQFITWCYNNHFKRNPDPKGLNDWLAQLKAGKPRNEIQKSFRDIVINENRLEYARANIGITPHDFNLRDYVEANDKKKILYVMRKTLGDVFLSTGVIQGIRDKYPDADIYFATEPQNFDILKNNPNIKKVIPYHDVLNNSKFMEKEVFDMAYTPAIITQMAEHYVHKGNAPHMAESYANMCNVELGQFFIQKDILPDFPFAKQSYITVHTKTSMDSKNYTNFKKIIECMEDVNIVLLGGPKDPEIKHPQLCDLRGKTTINQCAWLIQNAIMHIGLDSIHAHLASYSGTPSVILMGATYPGICGPMQTYSGCIISPEKRNANCEEPCHMASCGPKKCIDNIPERKILEKILEVFNKVKDKKIEQNTEVKHEYEEIKL